MLNVLHFMIVLAPLYPIGFHSKSKMFTSEDSVVAKYKVLVCGKTHTGKTSIIRQYIEHNFIAIFFPTPLPMAESTRFTDEDGAYELNIWDTAGSEEWLAMNVPVFNGSHVVVFVASYDEENSLSEIVDKWVPMVKKYIDYDNCVKILAVNKKDLLDEDESNVQITRESLERTRDDLQAKLFEVSAKTNEKVSDIFEYARIEVRKKFPCKIEKEEEEAPQKPERKDNSCCSCS